MLFPERAGRRRSCCFFFPCRGGRLDPCPLLLADYHLHALWRGFLKDNDWDDFEILEFPPQFEDEQKPQGLQGQKL